MMHFAHFLGASYVASDMMSLALVIKLSDSPTLAASIGCSSWSMMIHV